MATHDYVLDNATGANFRSDLNNALAAIVSNNSNSSEPSTKYAYQWWVDTTTNIVKIRNSANDGWINLFTTAGGIDVDAASNFAAVVTFTADVTFDGATAGRDIVFDRSDNALEFADNAKAKFGADGDLEIYHNGSNSYVAETGTGVLVLSGSAGVYIQKHSHDETMAAFLHDGAVELYHNNVKKAETVSGGFTVTGTCTATAFAGDGSALTGVGATITIDMARACHHSVTLGGNRTFAAPSNQVVGQSGSIFITQDGTGSRTASFNSAFKFVGGTAPTLTTTAAAVDRIDYVILSSNVIHCAVSLDVK